MVINSFRRFSSHSVRYRSSFVFPSVWSLGVYRTKSDVHFSSEKFVELCENRFSRFEKNPPVTNYLLLQQDDKKHNIAVVSEFSFNGITPKKEKPEHIVVNNGASISVPKVKPILNLNGFKNAVGDVLLEGNTDDGIKMIGVPLCQIDFMPNQGVSQYYTYYSMRPDDRTHSPIHIVRLNNSLEAKKLENQKGGKYKEDSLVVKNNDVPKRIAIAKRDPDQNTVMGLRAVEEYQNCAGEYGAYLNPALKSMLIHSANIMHLSTLRARLARKEPVSEEEKKIALSDRLLRTEWLHLLSFGLHPMEADPQDSENLGAARACDNTRMMLLEYVLRWFALNVSESNNKLSGRFDLLFDTHVIDMITLLAVLHVNEMTCKLTQKIDALVLNPQHISASDLAGLIAILSFLLQKTEPISKEIVKINSIIWNE